MFKSAAISAFVFALGVMPFAPGAQAATTIYTDRAAFDLATGGSLSFEDFSSGNASGAGFTTTNAFVNGAGQLRGRPTIFGSDVTYSFGSAITAFGGDFDTSPGGSGIGLRFTLDTGEVVSQELSAPYTGFWGFVADTSFSSVVASGGSGPGFAETHTMDNFSFGVAAPVAPVPVPAGLPMLLAALAAAFGLRQMQLRTSA